MTRRGLFITFEGIDGSGKTTQARHLLRNLRQKDVPVLLTREPGGVNLEICEKIRNILLSKANTNMAQETELLLFMTSRSQHVRQLIEPSLQKGMVVICDRFADASVAYQGYGRGLQSMAWGNKEAL